jgi:GH24 family phage-related lysozyme (muramidase)
MKTSKNGRKLITRFEGCHFKAYKCPAGKWTIGVGHTGLVDGKAINSKTVITAEECDELLIHDLEKAEHEVNEYNSRYDYDWNQNQFDALVSFVFNVGNLNQLTAGGTRNNEVISRKILLYDKANGEVLAGLVNRRKAEHDLFVRKEGVK